MNSSQESQTYEETSGDSSTQKNSSKYRRIRNKKSLKRQILNQLLTVGHDDVEIFLNNSQWHGYDPKEIIKFVNDFARNTQTAVEHDNKQLESLHKLANLLAPSKDTPKSCQPKHEIALALDAIAHVEPHPPQNLADTVNLSTVYHKVACLMKGEPVGDVDINTIGVIHEAMNEVMTEVESAQGKEDLRRLQDLLLHDKFDEFTQEQAMQLKMIFDDETFNPFKMPLEFLVNKPS